MAGVAHNLTITSPAGTLTEVVSVDVTTQGLSEGYSQTYQQAAGSLTLVSYDAPSGVPGSRGSVSISGTNFNESFDMAVVESVDRSATTDSAVVYTTTLRLIDLP